MLWTCENCLTDNINSNEVLKVNVPPAGITYLMPMF